MVPAGLFLLLVGLTASYSCRKEYQSQYNRPWTGYIDVSVNGISVDANGQNWWLVPIHYSLTYERIVSQKTDSDYTVEGYSNGRQVLLLQWKRAYWDDGWFFLSPDTSYPHPPYSYVGCLQGKFVLKDSVNGRTIPQMSLTVGFSGVSWARDTSTLDITVQGIVDTTRGEPWGGMGIYGTVRIPRSSFKKT